MNKGITTQQVHKQIYAVYEEDLAKKDVLKVYQQTLEQRRTEGRAYVEEEMREHVYECYQGHYYACVHGLRRKGKFTYIFV